jgi:uroporphyrinogen III methyltransferase/synthase
MKVLITRPRAQSASFGSALQMAGFEPVYFPVIEIRPADDLSALDAALAEIGKYAWVVLTSVNGVEIVAGKMKEERKFSAVKFAAVGKKTAEALRRHGIEPFFVPEEFTGEQIVPGLGDLRGKWVLLPRAEIARKQLPEAIVAAGGVAHEIAIYRTLPAQVDAKGLAALRAGVDWITFTSPSTVQNFAQVCRQNGLDPLSLPGNPKIACIGPVTEQAARYEGFEVAVTAAEYTIEGLIAVISDQSSVNSL